MKRNNLADDIEPRPVALFAAIAIVLGILLDRIFFLLAVVIALIAPLNWLIELLHKNEQPATPQPRRI